MVFLLLGFGVFLGRGCFSLVFLFFYPRVEVQCADSKLNGYNGK